jgi:hypothetical protein
MFFDVKLVLAFHAEVILQEAPYDYTCDDIDLANPSFYAQWSTVVWNDVRPQPSDSDLFPLAPQYENWLRDKDQARFAAIESDKFDNPTGTTDQYVRGNGSLATFPTIPSITTQSHINDGATDAPTDAPTNLNVLTTLLGSLTGEVNATNTKQNALAAKYNDLATKFNTLLDKLEANSLLATS